MGRVVRLLEHHALDRLLFLVHLPQKTLGPPLPENALKR